MTTTCRFPACSRQPAAPFDALNREAVTAFGRTEAVFASTARARREQGGCRWCAETGAGEEAGEGGGAAGATGVPPLGEEPQPATAAASTTKMRNRTISKV